MARGAEEEAADNAVVVARLSAALKNPALSDLVLMSERDGTKTPAAAILLASCSPVFMQMLTGAFAEGVDGGRKRSRDTEIPAAPVSCSFSGEAVEAIVAFAATNDAPALWSGSAQLLSEILEASEYYDIDDLRVKAKRQLLVRTREVPEEACEVLQAVWERWATDEFGTGAAGEVAEAALAAIDSSADVSLLGCGCLCEEAMKKVLGGQSASAGEVGKFRALQKWLSIDEDRRRDSGERLVSSIFLERMPPTFVADVVAKSGLVSSAVLLRVFQALAVKAELDYGLNTQDEFALPTWCSSGSVEFSCPTGVRADTVCVGLLDRSLSIGCWTWEIRVERRGRDVEVGLVTGDVDLNSSLGNQACAYVYDRMGFGWSAGSSVGERSPRFEQGDTIRLNLDSDKGILFIRVNDGAPYEVLSEIKQYGNFRSFRPALSLTSDGCARLLSFNRVLPGSF